MMITKQKLAFDAISVVAVIDLQGELIAYVLKNKSIGVEELLKLSGLIREKYGRKRVNIFLDNLPLHHTKRFKSECFANNQHLIFNASYSSELNPIERLWALSKKKFGRTVMADCDFSSQAMVSAFVEKTLVEVAANSLALYVVECFRRIVDVLTGTGL